MDETLYRLMNWPEIETIVYSEHDAPHTLLGAHVTEFGILYQAFFPEVQKVEVLPEGRKRPVEMVCVDEAGFYAVLLSGKRVEPYLLIVTDKEGEKHRLADPYAFAPVLTEAELTRFGAGIHYEVYNMLGAHKRMVNGVSGVLFAVWAPNAMRVSVVGDFNHWDGRVHQMRRLSDFGVFELFIPGLTEGCVYKYELKAKGGLTYCKADPYAFYAELRPANASVVYDLSDFAWTDAAWTKQREAEAEDWERRPMSVYEVHLGSFCKREDGTFCNYRELAHRLAAHLERCGYTHVELMPIMEHPFDASWGYQTTGYYAATARYGTPKDFMYFVNYLHEKGFGVILDWVPAHFPRDTFGLAAFDGTCLYEHLDPRKGQHPHWGTLIFNYGRPQVSNFLIGNALFWADLYHIDGIRMDAVASMLYLDYGREDGAWLPNIYGGKENLEAIEFLKHLNSIMKKRFRSVRMIAEESTSWPKVTGAPEDGGLGFDLKWNMGWMNDFVEYMKQDPLFRKGCHGWLTFSMIYAYSERFILPISHDEVVHGKCSMINKMPGTPEEKLANLRAAYGFMMTHPGKKLLFMGQEFGQATEWNEEEALPLAAAEESEPNRQMLLYLSELNRLYRSHPALYEADYETEGFQWLSCLDADHSIISFMRRDASGGEQLMVVCNFTPVVYEKFAFGVPFAGKYKEIFNSDKQAYGGSGHVNPRLKQSKRLFTDGLEHTIELTVPPLGISILTCTPAAEKEKKA